MRKLIVVYNPQSTQHAAVKREVLDTARKVKGYLVGKFEVDTEKDVGANARALARMLDDGDLVVAAGGDGTATIAVNAAMELGKAGEPPVREIIHGEKGIEEPKGADPKVVTVGVLGYGNFNDMAGMLRSQRPVQYGDEYLGGLLDIVAKFEAGEVTDFYPMEVKVNQKHWRYVPCYFTIGLFAESTIVFDDEKVRERLLEKGRSLVFSWMTLAKWYFRNRRREFLPSFRLNGVKAPAGTTDYVAMNGKQMAKVMRGEKWYLRPRSFGRATAELGKFSRLVGLMVKSIVWRVPTRESEGDVIEFDNKAKVMLHAEGEYEEMSGVRKIEVTKPGVRIKVVKF